MPKKKATPPQPEPKKPQVLALKKNPLTPALDAQVKTEAPITPENETEPPVVSVSEPTPGAEVITPDPQPVTENLTPALDVEVKLDAPVPTPGTKSVRPVLKKKSDRSGEGETPGEASTTPGLLEAPPDGAIFQAVGVITGEVTFNAEGKATVAIEGKEYPLFYAPQHKKAYEALKIEIKKTGVSHQRLLVYPRVIHFPKREEPHQIAFQLVGFFRTERDANPEEITSELGDFEFKLAGLWQFIPVCQTPCVSIFKNYTEERKEFIKAADVDVKVKFMKGTHVPILWRDAPVRPFRFNPKLDKEHQGSAPFVQVKATFLPDKGVFQVQELTSTPAAKPPRFLKAGKADKLQVASAKLRALKGNKGGKGKPQVVKKAPPNAEPTNDSQREIG
jgi:hypothetical protein